MNLSAAGGDCTTSKCAVDHWRLAASLRFTCARRLPESRFDAAFSLAASLTSTRFTTLDAPAFFASLVAVPLCCSTSVFPVMVATPPCTWTSNLSLDILEAASLARIAFSISASFDEECPAAFGVTALFLTVGVEAGLATGLVWPRATAPSRARQESNRYIRYPDLSINRSLDAESCYTQGV